jgi:hypothetical protein
MQYLFEKSLINHLTSDFLYATIVTQQVTFAREEVENKHNM